MVVTIVSQALVDATPARVACQDDFFPCSCSENDGTITVECNGVSGMDIRSAFNGATSISHVDQLFIQVPDSCGFFPADMLRGKTATSIYVRGNSCSLVIDSNAFISTLHHTKVFDIRSISLQFLDFAFLRGFSVLETLFFFECSDVYTLQLLPSLPSVLIFVNDKSSGSASITDFPVGRSFERLVEFYWRNGDLNDSVAEIIFEAVSQSPSVNTIKTSDISFNYQITRMPTALSHFQNLEKLYLMKLNITVLKTGSFLFHVNPPVTIYLYENPITSIEAAAFVGKWHKKASIDKLTNISLLFR